MPGIIDKLIGGGLKGLGDTAKDIIKQVAENKLAPIEAQAKIDAEVNRHEEEILKAQLADTANARNRETEFVKATGHTDRLMWVLAVSAMVIFGYMVYMVIRQKVVEENRELIFHIFGIVEGVLLSIFSYYFGSSAGSRIKDMKR